MSENLHRQQDSKIIWNHTEGRQSAIWKEMFCTKSIGVVAVMLENFHLYFNS